MPALGVQYDPRNFDPDTRPDPFPEGKYRFMVLKSDVRRTKSGDGSYLWLEFDVQGGPHNGRKFFDQLTLDNPNPQAVEIGQRQLSALCHTVGFLKPLQNSDDLHGLSGEADIGIEPAGKDDRTGKTFGPKNVVKKYIVPGGAAGNGGAAQSPASATATATATKKPWQK